MVIYYCISHKIITQRLSKLVFQTAFYRLSKYVSHKSQIQHHLLDTVHLGYLSMEGQGDRYPPDRRNLPSMVLKALRVPQHHSSNQGDMAGTLPERGNKKHEA